MDTPKSSDTYEGKTVDWKADPEYLNAVMSKVKFPTDCHMAPYTTKLLIALMVQNNLLLDKLCNLLIIATGLKEEDVNEAMQVGEDTIKNAVGKSTYCNTCQAIRVADRMGYCPKCRNDLSKQIFMELHKEHDG
jgi:uncharacterized paraquat-inducible protein A